MKQIEPASAGNTIFVTRSFERTGLQQLRKLKFDLRRTNLTCEIPLVAFHCAGRTHRNILPRERGPPASREIPENQVPGNASHREQHESPNPLAKYQLANPKQASVDQDHAHNPVERV